MKDLLKHALLTMSRRTPPRLKDGLLAIPMISRARDWIYRNSCPEIFIVPGLPLELKLYLDPEYPGERLFLTRQHEPHVISYLIQTVKPGWICLDVGAFIGFYSVLLGKLCGPQGRVIAFEPLEVLKERILTSCQANGLNNVTVESLALGAELGEIDFWVHKTYLGFGTSSSFRRNPGGYKTKVPLMTVDHYVRIHKIEQLNLIKIDVEGAELEVLEGARNTLASLKPLIIVELNNEDDMIQAEEFLGRLGYEIKELGRASYGVHVVAAKT